MTAYRFVTLTCDRCGEIHEGGTDTTVAQAREGAAAEGWRYERRRDLCPRCKNAALRWPVRWPDRKPAESGEAER